MLLVAWVYEAQCFLNAKYVSKLKFIMGTKTLINRQTDQLDMYIHTCMQTLLMFCLG